MPSTCFRNHADSRDCIINAVLNFKESCFIYYLADRNPTGDEMLFFFIIISVCEDSSQLCTEVQKSSVAFESFLVVITEAQ